MDRGRHSMQAGGAGWCVGVEGGRHNLQVGVEDLYGGVASGQERAADKEWERATL